MTFKKLKQELKDIAGEWDGDNPGIKEDRAHNAIEALEIIEKLEEKLEVLNLKEIYE